MKIFSVLKAFFILLIFSLLSLVISCESRAETVSCFPSQIINVQLNLNLPAYANDLNTKGWIYINEQQSGTRGLTSVLMRILHWKFRTISKSSAQKTAPNGFYKMEHL